MRSKSVGRIMSTYLGCRHVRPAGMAKFLSSQSVNELSQNISKGRRKQSVPEKTSMDTPTTIKFQSKTYTLKMEKISPSVKRPNKGINRMLSSTIKTTLGGEMHGSDDIVDTMLNMRDGVLQSLSDVPILNPEKPLLAPADRITKLKSKIVSDSPSYVVFAKEIFSPKERMSANDFMLEKDMVHKEQSLNILFRKYLQDGDDSLSSLDPDLESYWKSLKPVLSDLTNAQCFNDKATHSILKYAQGFECIANYKGTPSIISMGKINTQYVPKLYRLELVAGAAAFNSDQQWPVQVENFVLILARRDGSPAIVNVFNNANTTELWAECLMRTGKFWSETSTVKLVMERLISATMKLNSPSTMSSIDQISGKTLNEFVTNSKDNANQSKATEVKVDQNTARSPVLSHEDVKPGIKGDSDEEKKFDSNKPKKDLYQSNEQPKVKSQVDVSSTDKFANKKTNTQHTNAESKPEGGVLTSLWNFWKSK